MIDNDPNSIRCGDTEEGAALGLLGLMTGISEEFWCAGWMSGLEFDLWQAPTGKSYGQGQLTERQATLLKLLSDECDGWWYWRNHDGPKFIRLDEWRAKLAALSNGDRDHG